MGNEIEADGVSEVDSLIDALAQTAFVITAVLSRIAAEHDLSLTQLRMLGILRDRRLRISDLADFLGLEKSTLSGLVDRASKRGLLDRAANPEDGRAVDVLLSARGIELAERVGAQVAESLRPMTGVLGAQDQRHLQQLLDSMLAAT